MKLRVSVRNTGASDGDEVVQLYVTKPRTALSARHALARFTRVRVKAGETRIVAFDIDARALSQVDAQGVRRVRPGRYNLFVGGGQPGHTAGVSAALTVVGSADVAR